MNIISFGYRFKRPSPIGADIVIDVRCIEDPNHHPDFHALTGLDAEVRDYLSTIEDVSAIINIGRHIGTHLDKMIHTLAIGCHSGRHRSVYIAQAIADHLTNQGKDISIVHLDIHRTKEDCDKEDNAPDFI